MKAFLKNARHAPRKMRLMADLIKGKPVLRALEILSVAPKRAAMPLEKLLKSAISNAKNMGVPTDTLVVKDCRVDGGVTFRRFMPGARGSAFRIKKHTSHVNLVLDSRKDSGKKGKKVKKQSA